jgi:multimeric flavodoxin WrbA
LSDSNEHIDVRDKKEFPEFIEFDYNKPNGNYVNKTENLNVLGISCTSMPQDYTENRSTSEISLVRALTHAKSEHGCNTVHVKLRELEFGFCEGYYSSNKKACEWPCVITDREGEKDKMDVIYYGLTEWADIVVISTPIRYGNPTSLYFKMVERLNTVHNQMTLHDRHLIKDKVACFLITGGQDNVQHTAGEMITFFSEMGFIMPRYSYAAWTRGWYAEHMAKSFDLCVTNKEFENDIKRMIDTAVDLKGRLNSTKSSLTFDSVSKSVKRYEQISYEQYDPSSNIGISK